MHSTDTACSSSLLFGSILDLNGLDVEITVDIIVALCGICVRLFPSWGLLTYIWFIWHTTVACSIGQLDTIQRALLKQPRWPNVCITVPQKTSMYSTIWVCSIRLAVVWQDVKSSKHIKCALRSHHQSYEVKRPSILWDKNAVFTNVRFKSNSESKLFKWV